MQINLLSPQRNFPLYSGNLVLMIHYNNDKVAFVITVHCGSNLVMTRIRKTSEWNRI